ncbi:hypothetical protein [Leptolyngbya sp. PCC 6406]|uniref:hypothetical protein n=1 Tax=Leptolyngbya sp. PCC 6406 TaxID=1173264 RepID=UPI0002ABA79B|nr:hypothetical protein [Leptolyngbya sp. PCC 6406]
MQKSTLLAIAILTLGFNGGTALADNAPGTATSLLPLETRDLSPDVDPERLQSISTQVNEATFGRKEPSEGVFDPANMPWLRGFIGENGEAKLPLGLTVFSTMGDPSVGFGGSF